MKKHPTTIKGFSVDEIVREFGALRYDAAEEHLKKLADEYKRQAEADLRIRNYVQLSAKLYEFSEILYLAKDKMEEIFKLCKPHMKDELENE